MSDVAEQLEVRRFIQFAAALLSMMSPGLMAAGPTERTQLLESELECDMSMRQVEAILGVPLKRLDPPRFWKTHASRLAHSDIALRFEEDKLKFVQLSWLQLPTRVASFQRIDLCGDAPATADTVHRLKKADAPSCESPKLPNLSGEEVLGRAKRFIVEQNLIADDQKLVEVVYLRERCSWLVNFATDSLALGDGSFGLMISDVSSAVTLHKGL